MQINLTRELATDRATIGSLEVDTDNVSWYCKTLELPWRNNKRNVSCIPEGNYEIDPREYGFYYEAYRKKDWTPKHTFSLEVADVEGRGDILIHTGNYPRHTKGCILVGQHADTERLYNSYGAYKTLWKYIRDAIWEDEEVFLNIGWESLEFEPGRPKDDKQNL